MKLSTARELITPIVNKPFCEYVPSEVLKDAILNKGKTGQFLELTIGLKLSSSTLDFEDGELKTNKCDQLGIPKETMFITQVSSIIDELIATQPFEETKLYRKLSHLLYVPICKTGSPADWMYLPCLEVNLSLPKYSELKAILEADYYSICKQINAQLSQSPCSTLHTVNGNFLQIRTKDSKPYHPIFSRHYNRIVSDKNRAFYFKKDYMQYIVSLEKQL